MVQTNQREWELRGQAMTVAQILSDLLAIPEGRDEEFRAGDRVRLQSLERTKHLNGKFGVLQSYDATTGRWAVKFEDANDVQSHEGGGVKVLKQNLTLHLRTPDLVEHFKTFCGNVSKQIALKTQIRDFGEIVQLVVMQKEFQIVCQKLRLKDGRPHRIMQVSTTPISEDLKMEGMIANEIHCSYNLATMHELATTFDVLNNADMNFPEIKDDWMMDPRFVGRYSFADNIVQSQQDRNAHILDSINRIMHEQSGLRGRTVVMSSNTTRDDAEALMRLHGMS